MLKPHQIKLLREAGHTQGWSWNFTGVCERSIRRIQGEPPPPDLDDAQEAGRRGLDRRPGLERHTRFTEGTPHVWPSYDGWAR